jgi:threonine dehydrogenase-like Zn-dependent dehydrogenase
VAVKAVVWQAPGQIDVQEIPDARIEQPSDAVVRLTMSAICGTDLHMVRGTMPGMVPGTVLGHEGVGVVEAVGENVRGFVPGDRVVIPSTICCGTCVYCRAGYTSQCDKANPNGPTAGTSFFGGPKSTGPINGLQASFARIPFAAANLIPLPDAVFDEQAIVLSDIYPTAWFGAQCAEVSGGDTVAVFGCGPVGQLAIASVWRMGAGRVIAVDNVPARLEGARSQHAEPVDFGSEDPVAVIRELTGGTGADRVIDAVGVDSYSGSGEERTDEISESAGGGGTMWGHGTAPAQAAEWAVESVASRQHRHHRCLPAEHADLAARRGDEQEPHGEDGQLPTPRDHPATGGPGGQRRRRPGPAADPDRADRRRGHRLPHLRHPRARVGEGCAGSCGVTAVPS